MTCDSRLQRWRDAQRLMHAARVVAHEVGRHDPPKLGLAERGQASTWPPRASGLRRVGLGSARSKLPDHKFLQEIGGGRFTDPDEPVFKR
jgi:hypothetical protein